MDSLNHSARWLKGDDENANKKMAWATEISAVFLLENPHLPFRKGACECGATKLSKEEFWLLKHEKTKNSDYSSHYNQISKLVGNTILPQSPFCNCFGVIVLRNLPREDNVARLSSSCSNCHSSWQDFLSACLKELLTIQSHHKVHSTMRIY